MALSLLDTARGSLGPERCAWSALEASPDVAPLLLAVSPTLSVTCGIALRSVAF